METAIRNFLYGKFERILVTFNEAFGLFSLSLFHIKRARPVKFKSCVEMHKVKESFTNRTIFVRYSNYAYIITFRIILKSDDHEIQEVSRNVLKLYGTKTICHKQIVSIFS